jgi:hypothetical protein
MDELKRLKSVINSLTKRINALANVPYYGTLKWQPISELEDIVGAKANKLKEEIAQKLGESDSARLEFVLAAAGRLKENAWVKAAEEHLDQFNIKIPSRIIKGFVFNIYGTKTPTRKLLIIGQKQGSPKMILIADPDRKRKIQTVIETKLKEEQSKDKTE